jgi:hypothetical protein
MSYQNGSATSTTDLLQQLVTFLVAAGWTLDMSQIEGTGWRAHLHKSGNYVHLRAAEAEAVFTQHTSGVGYSLNLYTGIGFNSGQPWNNQGSGAPVGFLGFNPIGVAAVTSAGPFTNYYFMTDSSADNVVVIIEKTPGLFVHVGWGLSLNLAGSITGGAYFFGSSGGNHANTTIGGVPANTPGYTSTALCPGVMADSFGQDDVCFVRADVDAFTGNWIGIGANVTAATGYTGKVGASSVKGKNINPAASIPMYAQSDGVTEFQALQTSALDGRANLLPVYLWANRDGTSTGYSLLGSLPIVFAANGVGNGFSNASEYTIGSDTYKMFPNFAVLKV